MADASYVATGACSGCPYRVNCHGARQRALDTALGLGRHTACRFYQEFERREEGRARVARAKRTFLQRLGVTR